MNNRPVVLIIVLSILVLPSCAGMVNKQMESWQGKHFQDLIAAWGAPEQVLDDGQGGKILVYSAQRTFASPGYSTSYASGTGTVIGSTYFGSAQRRTTYYPGYTSGYKASRMFWVGQDGYIYKWAWRGL